MGLRDDSVVKAFATNSNYLNLVAGTHTEQGKRQLPQAVPWPPRVWNTHTHMDTCLHNLHTCFF